MISLIIRSLAGLLFLLGVLALALFASAGTFAYWRAWLYLAVFGISVLFITAYLVVRDRRLLESRLNVGPAAETQRSQIIIQWLASAFFIALFIVPGLDHRFGWSHVPPLLSVGSDVLVALSLFFVFLVFRENSFTSAIVEVSSDQRVVSTGPYAIVRHPMYSGALLLLVFTPLALGSWVGLPFAIPLIGVIVARLLNEEKFLAASLPGYAAYRKKVRWRLLPGVW